MEFADNGEGLLGVRSDIDAINSQEGVSYSKRDAPVSSFEQMVLREALSECGGLLYKILIVAGLRSGEGRLK